MNMRGLAASIFRQNRINLSSATVETILTDAEAPAWFKYAFRERGARWDITESCFWIARNLPASADILETGCGCAFNLIWLGQQRFKSLYGFDIDTKVIRAAHLLASAANTEIALWVDNGLEPKFMPVKTFDMVFALNWTFLLPEFDLYSWVQRWAEYVKPGRYLMLDVIDASYNQVTNNNYLTGDWNRPEDARRPSEYKKRYSHQEIMTAFDSAGFKLVQIISRPQLVPKTIYVGRRDNIQK